MGKLRVLIIIPAYNEAESLPFVIRELDAHVPQYDFLVVNDASVDNTLETARNLPCKVLNLPVNIGVGGAVQAGFKYAQHHQYDAAVQFDGDGQHLAEEIASILSPIEFGESEVVIGSRFLDKTSQTYTSSPTRLIGIRILSFANKLLTDVSISDCTSGFRAYNRRAFSFLAEHYPTEYPEPEAGVLLAKNLFRLKEIPTHMRKRYGGTSSINYRNSSVYMFKVLLGMLMTALRSKANTHSDD